MNSLNPQGRSKIMILLVIGVMLVLVGVFFIRKKEHNNENIVEHSIEQIQKNSEKNPTNYSGSVKAEKSTKNNSNLIPSKPEHISDKVEGCFTQVFDTPERRAEIYAEHLISSLRVEENTNPKSFCLKIANIPTKFKSIKNADGTYQIRFSAIDKGIKKVEVSWCTKKSDCQLSCEIPKDEFMDALLGAKNNGKNDTDAGWGGKPASEDEKKLNKEIDAFAEALKADPRQGVLNKWNGNSIEIINASVCKQGDTKSQKQASLR